MSDTRPTAEIESLIQGYVEGELTAAECARLRSLLEGSPELVTPILTSLRTDALIRQTVLQSATADVAPHDAMARGEGATIQIAKPRRRARLAVRLGLAAGLMALAALATVFFSNRQSVAPAVLSNETGSILYEYWNDIPGGTITDLTAHPNFQRPADGRAWLLQFEAPANRGENYGARVRGFLRPPVSGDYLFWIASDDASELWLSENESPASKKRICFVDSWTPVREWTWQPSQQSQPIRLEAGRSYYLEALHKQGDTADSLAVAWQVPGGVREIIPGKYVSSPEAPR